MNLYILKNSLTGLFFNGVNFSAERARDAKIIEAKPDEFGVKLSWANAEIVALPTFVLSYGMGVESHAILERWIAEPDSRPELLLSLSDQLIVVTSQVGEENKSDTVPHVTRRTLPLLREHAIRFVELARRGLKEEAGIVVLQDTREPRELHPEGVYKLSDELLENGTIPQMGGEHRCAMKFKAFVIETWLAWEFRGVQERPIFHAFGYNAEETSRIAKSEIHMVRHNEERKIPAPKTPLEVFGFNCEEVGRIERNRKYDGPERIGLYPLADWKWNRAKCWEYIFERSGIDWKKSHCSFCPFCAEAAKGEAAAVARWAAAPEQTAHGMIVEFNALCFNPRGMLFKDRALGDVVRRHKVAAVLEAFERRLSAMQWGLYRVRRIYTKKGSAIRCVERLNIGTREEMADKFAAVLADPSVIMTQEAHGITYAMTNLREKDVYPTREGFFVIAPAFVGSEKCRGPVSKFDLRWQRVGDGLPMNPEKTTAADAEEETAEFGIAVA